VIDFLKNSLFSLLLRCITLLGRLFLVVFIGKYLSVNELGIYGLFFATVIFSTFFLGYDFYTFQTRELLSEKCDNKLIVIRDQFVFYIVTYIIVLPWLSLLFTNYIIPLKYIFLFYPILIFEHLSQEMFRLFTVLSKPIIANLILFIRGSLWVFIMILLYKLNIIYVDLNTIFFLWIIGGGVSLVFSVINLKKMKLGLLDKPINWAWITKGVKICTPFFIGTISYKIIEFSNRYFIDGLLSKHEVGIFTFFYSISNVVQTLIFTGVIMLIYPKMVETFSTKKNEYYSHYKNLKIFTVSTSLFFIIMVIIFIPYVLKLIDKADFQNNIGVLWILLSSTFAFILSLIPHYSLYVQKKDKTIMYITIFGATVNIILNFIFIKYWGINGAAFSLLVTYTLIFLLKQYYNYSGKISL